MFTATKTLSTLTDLHLKQKEEFCILLGTRTARVVGYRRGADRGILVELVDRAEAELPDHIWRERQLIVKRTLQIAGQPGITVTYHRELEQIAEIYGSTGWSLFVYPI